MPLGRVEENPENREIQEKPITEHSTPQTTFSYDGLPLDIYVFFNSSFDNSSPRDRDKMRDIYEYSSGKHEKPVLGDILQTMRDIESKLGYSGYDRKLDKVWNWVRLSRYTDDLDKRRRALEK